MLKEGTIYKRVVRGLTDETDIETRRLALSGLADYLQPKIAKLPPRLSRSDSTQRNLQTWDLGLDALGTLVTKYQMSGESDKSKKLTVLLVKGATTHLKDLADNFGVDGVSSLNEQIRKVALKASRHSVIAIEDFRRAGLPIEDLSRDERSALTLATALLQRYKDPVLELFGSDGRNEISLAINSDFQRRVRSTRAYPG